MKLQINQNQTTQHLFLLLSGLWPSDVRTQALSLYFEGPYSQGAVVQGGMERRVPTGSSFRSQMMRSGGWTLLVLQSVKVITWLFYLLALNRDCLKARGAIYHTWNKGIKKNWTWRNHYLIPGCNISHFLSISHPRSQSIQKAKSSKDESLPCSEVTACTGLCLPLTEGVCEAFRGARPYSRQKSESLERANLQAQVHARLVGAPGGTWGPNAQAGHSHYHISSALLA